MMLVKMPRHNLVGQARLKPSLADAYATSCGSPVRVVERESPAASGDNAAGLSAERAGQNLIEAPTFTVRPSGLPMNGS